MKPLIIMPAYNVSERISEILCKMDCCRKNTLIVDDGSTDDTLNYINRTKFIYISNEVNKGVSYSVKRGIDWAKKNGYDKVILMDSDGQHDPKFITEFESALDNNDYIYGSRFRDGDNIPSSKLASNALASLLVKERWKCSVNDVACGFKAFHLFKGIEDHINVQGRYSLVYDILFYCLEKEYKISNINISTLYYPNELWYTRIIEIDAMIKALERYTIDGRNNQLENVTDVIKKGILNKVDFKLSIGENVFYAFFLTEYNGYIIQSDIEKSYNVLR